MLTQLQSTIIKSTVPLLENGKRILTKCFYNIMQDEYTDDQLRTLANHFLLYAKNIDNTLLLNELISNITKKETQPHLSPAQYEIIGTYLLDAIREVLGSELANDAVMDAWRAAYIQLTDTLKQLADGKPFNKHQHDQYLELRFVSQTGEQYPNYAMFEIADDNNYNTRIQREQGGTTLNNIYNNVNESDMIRVFPATGDTRLQSTEKPLVLISGGMGITSILSMLEMTLEQSQRPVYFIHAARTAEVVCFRKWIKKQQEQYSQLQCFHCYEYDPDQIADVQGKIDETLLKKWLPENNDIDAYYLGPKNFMRTIKNALKSLGIPENQTHSAFFDSPQGLNA